MNRRRFLTSVGAGALGCGALGLRALSGPVADTHLRPPGALPEKDFRAACVRCGLCAGICPRGCIELSGIDDGPALAGLPFIDARQRACDLCMRCTEVCPTAALTVIDADKREVAARVAMGTAVVDESTCLSFLGRLCGICRDACPYPGEAIKLGSWARPIVIAEACVGCGLCVEICPQQPTSIRIDPAQRRKVPA